MYSDSFFNFFKTTEDLGTEEGTEIFAKLREFKPDFLLDVGIREGDIWQRVERIRECLDGMEDEQAAVSLRSSLYFAAGIMPDSDSVENRFSAVEELEQTIIDFKESDDEFASRLVAIGPAGIDHDWDSVEYEGRDHEYFDNDTILDERDLFALQLTLGKKLNMPVLVHSRRGFNDTMDVLKAVKWNKGVIHGFSYSQSELEFFLDLGWYISFSGATTYGKKKSFNDMADVVAYIPKDRILIESDSPYYAPVPIKNEKNTPANIKYTYEYIAAKRGIPMHKLSDIVDENFKKVFGLK